MVFPQPGDQLGRYRIDWVIGQDGLGVVYAATDERLQRTVAMTVVRSEIAGRPGFTSSFREAATRLSRLSSPYIAQVHDHEAEGGLHFLVSQYVPDGDLETWLQQHGPLSQHAALVLAEQAAGGLADAHRQGLAHGDVGPRHVLVREAGSARAHAWLTGFPLTGENHSASVDGDLQGIGRLLVAALTGTDPGAASPPPAPGRFGPLVEDLLGRLLGPDPAARPPHADALRAELSDLAGRWAAPVASPAPPPSAAPTAPRPTGTPTAVRPAAVPAPAGPPESPAPERRRGFVLALVAGAVALVVVAGSVAWSLLADGDDEKGDPSTAAPPAVTGDLDGDGRGDVLLDRINPESFGKVGETVFLPSGDDGLSEPVVEPYPDSVDVESFPRLQLADIDGDGLLDRVFTSGEDVALVIDVVPAEGEPWHQEIRSEGTAWGPSDDVATLFGDLDRDGRADLIVADEYVHNDGVRLFVGLSGEGEFAEPEQWYESDNDADLVQFDVADFDGDGEDDVLATLEGDGPGDGQRPWDIALQLITSDGSALADAGEVRPLEPGDYPQGVRLYGDLDGDGADEPLLVGPDGFATTEFADGSAPEVSVIWEAAPDNRAWQDRFARYSSSATANWVMSDVDGDGDDDLVFLKHRGDAAKRATVRMAEDGELAAPVSVGLLRLHAELRRRLQPGDTRVLSEERCRYPSRAPHSVITASSG